MGTYVLPEHTFPFKGIGNYPFEGGRYAAACQAGRTCPEVEELLDVIRQLLDFSRAGTLDQEKGEVAAYSRAMRLLDRYKSARSQRS
jgi:hypothetical protein